MGNQSRRLKQACVKTLSKSELYDQKELNGVMALKPLFGEQSQTVNAIFSVRGQPGSNNAALTWYNSREKNALRNEYRLYFEANPVMNQATPGDNIVIGYDDNNTLNCILFKNGDAEHQGPIGGWVPYS